MVKINENFLKLPGNYLFSEIARRVEEFSKNNPNEKIIRMGIGDVTRPLIPAVISKLHESVMEMGEAETFRGYGPEQGYDFLRETIAKKEYKENGIKTVKPDDIFVSDGAKSDCANIVDIFGNDNNIAVCDPVYPVYVDTNAMAGRAGDYKDGKWTKLIYMDCKEENDFLPELPKEQADIIYLCFPNNPTGVTMSKEELKKWVDYALENKSLILYDSAYEAFITQTGIPHSIFEIEGAEKCAIEFRSFSKTAGFTGTRCAYTVIPETVTVDGVSVADLWKRRQCTKFNGAPYIVQRAAASIYSRRGQEQIHETIDYYLENARIIREGLTDAGIKAYGGVNSPYIWAKTPSEEPSWDFFDFLLKEAKVVTTPGAGFGPCGEGYIRFTAFNTKENTDEAIERIKKIL